VKNVVDANKWQPQNWFNSNSIKISLEIGDPPLSFQKEECDFTRRNFIQIIRVNAVQIKRKINPDRRKIKINN